MFVNYTEGNMPVLLYNVLAFRGQLTFEDLRLGPLGKDRIRVRQRVVLFHETSRQHSVIQICESALRTAGTSHRESVFGQYVEKL